MQLFINDIMTQKTPCRSEWCAHLIRILKLNLKKMKKEKKKYVETHIKQITMRELAKSAEHLG